MATLTQIHTATNPNSLSVIFVHGLGGDARLTWMHNKSDHATLWPNWIGEQLDCNVWIAGYGAALSGWTDAAMHLAEQGEALFAALQAEPKLQVGRIVLIGHSLGGLVIKSGMTQAATLGDPTRERVLSKIGAVVFVGTPHQGANLASIASALAAALRTNPQVINMANDDAWLKLLNGQFRYLQQTREFDVRVFFETKGVLAGWTIFGLKVGRRITIVDRNSSDPGISGIIPTGIEGDHFEIAKPKSRESAIHKSLVEFLLSIEMPSESDGSLPNDVNVESEFPVRSELDRLFRNASAPLLTWPATLPDGTWLERSELQVLLSTLDESASSTHFLLGEPGCGKSSLLVRLAQKKQEAGWAVLAIKADRLPVETLDRESLNVYLNIGSDVAETVRHIARSAPVLVVIDQLDALADLVVQQSARLRVLLDLVQELSDAPNLHIVISCRTFEQKHDPALRTLPATVLTLELPAWPLIMPILVAKGLRAEAWNEEMQQVLRSPHALDIFLSSLEGATEPAALKSFQGLLEEQWTSQVLSDGSGRRRSALRHLAKLMAEREVLGLPLAIVEEYYPEIKELAAAGMLRIDVGPGRVEFRHQTLYEFVRARSFLEEGGSLTEAVRKRQGSLRIRPQLWHALGYFRGASPEEYGAEIGRLWEADLRPHLKMLLIEFLGRQTIPLLPEQQLVERLMPNPWFRPRFIGAALESPGWFAVLAQSHLSELMSLKDDTAKILVPLLRGALHFNANAVVDLVRQYWLPDPAFDTFSWQVLGMGEVAPQPGLWIDNLAVIARRTALSGWTIAHVAGVISAATPDEAPKIVAAWLESELDAAKAPLTNASLDADAVAAELSKNVLSVLETRQFHDMEVIAEASPKAFAMLIWPILIDALTLCSPRKPRITVGYSQISGLVIHGLDEEESSRDRTLLRSVQLAVQAWAESDSATFMKFAEEQTGSEVLLVHRILAMGRLRAVNNFPILVFNYLIGDQRRLVLGPYTDVHKESVALIGAIGMLLDEVRFAQLEQTVTEWQYLRDDAPAESDAGVRLQRLHWARQHRLRLLRALPEERRSPETQRFIAEEERAYPRLQNHDVHFSGVHCIGSPVSAEQMQKGTDADVLNLFSELTDESASDHPRDRMRGGAIQAGHELAGLAKLDLQKTLRIIRALEPVLNEIPVATALRELVPAGMDVQAFYFLIAELEDKGFVSLAFRIDAAYAVAVASSEASPVPESLIARMERWLSPFSSELSEEPDFSETSKNSAILWGHGSMTALPGGNYPTLSALTAACLSSMPRRVDRWLDVLEKHSARNESPRVWGALLQRELMYLEVGERSRAESLIDNIVRTVPNIVNDIGWIHFLARANHWASTSAVERWMKCTHDDARDKQGSGELISLRHALFPAEQWSRNLAYSFEEPGSSIVLGLAHGVAHLWLEPMTRPVVHPILMALLRSNDEHVLTALSSIFTRDTLPASVEIREFLDTIVANPKILKDGRAENLPESLAKLVTAEPMRVCHVAHTLLDAAGDQMGNIATSWYLSTEWLLDIALKLQDLGDTERAAGSTLFERMLEFNMPQAKEMTLDLDKRTPVNNNFHAPLRRRGRRGRGL